MVAHAAIVAATVLTLVSCVERATPGIPAKASKPQATTVAHTATALAPPALPAPTGRAKLVSIGRITERFTTADACEADADCVVVARHNHEELCPPGTVTNRAGFESDQRWGARGFAFRPPRAVCVDPRTTLRPLCLEKVCAGEAVPAGDADTDSEARVWAAHDKLETCQREAVERGDPGTGEVVFTMMVMLGGAVASARVEGTLPTELRGCLYRVMVSLQFRDVDVVLKLRVPLELRAHAI